MPPEFADVRVSPAECVGARIGVCGDRVGGDDGVAVVGAGAAPALQREHATHAEGRGAAAASRAAQHRALGRCRKQFLAVGQLETTFQLTCVAGSIKAASGPGGSADGVGEGDDVEDGEKSVRSWLGLQ